ncbi:hypothetical protein D918_03198 [Trichuris suis]|nr:hypothetical protein D918_03198 [Trichuris suis]
MAFDRISRWKQKRSKTKSLCDMANFVHHIDKNCLLMEMKFLVRASPKVNSISGVLMTGGQLWEMTLLSNRLQAAMRLAAKNQ